MKAIRLSPSKLNLYRECPRCFWLDKVKKIERPRGDLPLIARRHGPRDQAIFRWPPELRDTA